MNQKAQVYHNYEDAEIYYPASQISTYVKDLSLPVQYGQTSNQINLPDCKQTFLQNQ